MKIGFSRFNSLILVVHKNGFDRLNCIGTMIFPHGHLIRSYIYTLEVIMSNIIIHTKNIIKRRKNNNLTQDYYVMTKRIKKTIINIIK